MNLDDSVSLNALIMDKICRVVEGKVGLSSEMGVRVGRAVIGEMYDQGDV